MRTILQNVRKRSETSNLSVDGTKRINFVPYYFNDSHVQCTYIPSASKNKLLTNCRNKSYILLRTICQCRNIVSIDQLRNFSP